MQAASTRRIRLTRSEQQAATRERLIAAAEKVFSRLGYGGASVDLIAAEAGYSKGAVYSNFSNKEAIFLELLSIYMERDMAALEKIVSAEPSTVRDAATEWLKAMHEDSECPLLMTELQLHARRSPEFGKKFYELQAKNTETLGRILTSYFEANSTPLPMDPVDLARMITALAHGLTLQQCARDLPSDPGILIDSVLRLLTPGNNTI